MGINLPTIPDIKVSRLQALDLLPPRFKETYSQIPEDLRTMPDMELEEQFMRTPNDYRLRKRLWELVSLGQPISVDHWVKGLCEDSTVYRSVFGNHFRFMWILTPMTTFQETYEDTFHILMQKMRKYIISSEVSGKNIGYFAKLLETYGNRVVGPVITKIDMRRQDIPAPQVQAEIPNHNIDEEIKRLEEQKFKLAKSVEPDEPT